MPGATPIVGGAAADETPGLKELDEADRKAAEKQKTCPVSGEKLGAMGKPYKVTIQGRTFFLCCDGCLAELKAHPDKYLKKLNGLRLGRNPKFEHRCEHRFKKQNPNVLNGRVSVIVSSCFESVSHFDIRHLPRPRP